MKRRPVPAALRERAEAELARRGGADAELGTDDRERVIHELRVHEIELEVQNEELERIHGELAVAVDAYRELYDEAPVGYLTLGRDGSVRRANIRGAELFAVDREQLVHMRLHEAAAGEARRRLERFVARIFDNGGSQSCVVELAHEGAAPRFVELTGVVAPDRDECRIVGIDVTERTRLDAALRDRESKYRALFEGVHDALVTVAPPTWQFTSGNAALLAMLGFENGAELVEHTPWDVSPARQPDGRDSKTALTHELELTLRVGNRRFEWWFDRRSGESFPADVSLSRMEFGGVALVHVAIRDETAARALRESVAQSERLATLGLVAASIAHELNNPLSYVIADIDRLAEAMPGLVAVAQRCRSALAERVEATALAGILGNDRALLDDDALAEFIELARDVRGGVVRLRDTGRRLAAFARDDSDERTPVDVNASVAGALAIVANELSHRARVVQELGVVPMVAAPEARISQLLVDLLVNAATAIEVGDAAAQQITIRTRAEQGHVVIEIADTGRGIPPERLAHIFEPFGAGRPVGKRAGIGLVICHKIVTELGGTLSAESEVDRGSRFVVRLPAIAAPPVPVHVEPIPAELTGKILVIDDEPALCRALQVLLGRKHLVISASSGAEAQRIIEAQADFSAILCDLMMPGMTGIEFHRWLSAHDPRLASRLVFVTGGVFSESAMNYIAATRTPCIDKPFDPAGVLEIVGRLVAASAVA